MRIVGAWPAAPRNVFMVSADYLPHSFVPGSHERHQPLILGDGNESEKRIRVEGFQRREGDATGGSSSLLLATAGTEDRIHLDGGQAAVRRWKVVPVDVKNILRIVLVCEVEDGGQRFDIVDKRITGRVDDLEEHSECLWGIINVDDGKL